jgi:transposase
MLMGPVGRGGYEARVRELLEHTDPTFSLAIEAVFIVFRLKAPGTERLSALRSMLTAE